MSSAGDHAQPTLGLGVGFETAADIEHDPLDPHPEVPTPLSMVLRLTRRDRDRRLDKLIELAWVRYQQARDAAGSKEIVTVAALVSGGKDSCTIAALFRDEFDTIIHADTGTGIEATRTFVKDVAHSWGKRMVMARGEDDYFDLVLGLVRTKGTGEHVWRGGFPGSGAHGFMQQRLKERAWDKVRHDLGIANSSRKCAIWIAGRRRPESTLRATIPHVDVDGSVIWSSPLAVWHKADLLALRLKKGLNVPVGATAKKLGLSGECGCLANAHEGERDEWFAAYPDEPFLLKVLWAEALMQDKSALRDYYLSRGLTANDADATAERIYGLDERFKHWGLVGFIESDYAELPATSSGRLCTDTCGDPLLSRMDPLFHLEGKWAS